MQPYPNEQDEQHGWAKFEANEAALFERAGRMLDWSAFRYAARAGRDIGAGLEAQVSFAHHLAECAAELRIGPVPQPLPVPGPPYPDEPTWWAAVENEVAALYESAGHSSPDWAAFRWFSRIGYDIGRGMSPNASKAKHLAELRVGLGIITPLTAPVLHRDGRTIRTGDNSIWSWRMTSDFALLRRVMDGEDIGPLLEQRKAARANGVRVFGAKAASDNPAFPSLFVIDPRDPSIYDAADRLFTTLGQHGMSCEFVVFVDEQLFQRSTDAQRAHAYKMFEVIRGHRHVIGELVNEYQKNGIDPGQFSQPGQVALCSHGSGLSDADPALPAWTHTTYHPARDNDWPRKFKSALELQDLYDCACIVNEPKRCDEGDGTDVGDWYDGGALAHLYTPGATFHSQAGLRSLPWSSYEVERAAAFFDGMIAVSPEAQTGVYSKAIPNGFGLETYDELRTYGSIVGSGEQWMVVVRPGPGYPRDGGIIKLKAINGWKVTEQMGDRGTVVKLVR